MTRPSRARVHAVDNGSLILVCAMPSLARMPVVRVVGPFGVGALMRLQRLTHVVPRGAGVAMLWPGIERQPAPRTTELDAAIAEGVRRGLSMRVQGFRFLREIDFPDPAEEPGRPVGILELVVPSSLAAARRARRLAQVVAAASQMSESTRHDCAVAVGEALANAVRHGSPRGRRDAIALRLALFDDGFVIQVRDCGRFVQVAPESAEPAPDDAKLPEPDEGGWGLAIMRALVDDVRVQSLDGGTVVSLIKWTCRRTEHGAWPLRSG